jgi:hypothetical protein
MLAAGNVGGQKCRRPDSYYLGSAESPLCLLLSPAEGLSLLHEVLSPLKSSLSDGVVSPPCRPQVGSALKPAQLIWAASLPYWHGLLYRHDLSQCPRPSNVRGRRHFDPLF